METNNVNMEFQENFPKPSFTPKQECLINETLIFLSEKLTGLNKFSINEIVNGEKLYGVNVLRDLNGDFYIGGDQEKFLYSCHFGHYIHEDKKKYLQITAFTQHGWLENSKKLCFPKKRISSRFRRERIAIWIVKELFQDFGTEEELNNFFFHSVFSDSHNFIEWD